MKKKALLFVFHNEGGVIENNCPVLFTQLFVQGCEALKADQKPNAELPEVSESILNPRNAPREGCKFIHQAQDRRGG
nr:hypothetical protein [Pseudoramibacter sp. HA2172]